MKKTEIGEVHVERLDDIPVILGLLQKMHIQAVIDEMIDTHGNWQGLRPGWIITIWLVHILSEHNHNMDRVRAWVSKRMKILQALTGQTLDELDFTDDRLALCLRKLGEVDVWHRIEARLGSHLVRVYRLDTNPVVRLDATTGSVNHDPEKHPLFQVGKAKNGHYETQYKLMLASLDPMGMPLAVDVAAGNRADDPLYLPVYRRAKQVFPEKGLLVVGDSKMSAFATRATIAAGEDFYLTPLADRKDEPGLLEDLLKPRMGREDEMEHIFLPEDEAVLDPKLAIGHGFEVTRDQGMEVDGEYISWQERLLVIRSHQYEKTIKKGLHNRLNKAEKALKALTPARSRGKRQFKDETSLVAAIERIEKKYRVTGLFDYTYEKEVSERQVRAYGGNPARTEKQVRFQLRIERNQEAIAAAEFVAGWRIYATNAPAERLPLAQAVLAYRDQYIEENIFRRLKGKLLSISPLHIQRDDHAKGLFHLLTLAARLLALGDHLAKENLAQEETELSGIYPGNPKRSTATPTTERMLAAFDNINLTIVPAAGQLHYQVTSLTAVQKRILKLWELSETLYTQFFA